MRIAVTLLAQVGRQTGRDTRRLGTFFGGSLSGRFRVLDDLGGPYIGDQFFFRQFSGAEPFVLYVVDNRFRTLGQRR